MPDPFDPGVPLKSYRGQADVLLTCLGCGWTKTYPLEDVIKRLGEEVGIIEVAGHTKIACPKCRGRKWDTRPAFRDRPGQDGTRAEK